MAKKTSLILLFPGESAWETWTLAPSSQAELSTTHTVEKPSEIEKLPAGDLIHFFPVRSFTSLPLRVPTADTSLFSDLAATHAERAGLRPDPAAGQLTDVFPLFTNSEESTFLSVILKKPEPGDLPLKSPKAFDISARALPVKGNALSIWRELGNWVFAIHSEGKLLYCQATTFSAVSPDASLVRAIRIAIAQLSMQGIEASPTEAVIWSSDLETDTKLVSESFSVRTELALRPAPILPDPQSALLPEDVRAAHRAARKRQNIILAIAAIAILYLGTIGYLAYDLWKMRTSTAELTDRVKVIAPEGDAYTTHLSKWSELEWGLDLNYNTVDILSRVARSIPPNQGLRLRAADISPTEITISGEAPQPQAVNQFSLNLSKNNDLTDFVWQTPEPRQSSRGWEFKFTATLPTVP
ncbi:MAG: PilN domain-containing protein [Luteolibacter sp.]